MTKMIFVSLPITDLQAAHVGSAVDGSRGERSAQLRKQPLLSTTNLRRLASMKNQVRALFDCIHQVLNRELEFVLIAPVVVDGPIRGIPRAVEAFFDVVVPNHS